jgi:hypothetical protein
LRRGIEGAERVLKHHLDMPRLAADFSRDIFRPVVAVEHDRAASGSISRTMQRASVDLPEPDSPTMPSVGAARQVERNVLHGRRHPRRRAPRKPPVR